MPPFTKSIKGRFNNCWLLSTYFLNGLKEVFISSSLTVSNILYAKKLISPFSDSVFTVWGEAGANIYK